MAGMTYTFARNEKKFLITKKQKEELLSMLGQQVRPDEWGRSTVRSLYCDTPSRMMIRHSLEHPAYKEKIRIRTYGAAGMDDDVFLELKQKVDGVTYKRRATMPLSRALEFVAGNGDPSTQIEREIAATVARYAGNGGLAPATLIACEREAFFATEDRNIRLTFDDGIRWSNTGLSLSDGGRDETAILDDDLTLLEVKCGEAMPLWLVSAMSELGLRQTGFSKYGMAWKHQMIASGFTTASDGLAPAIAHARGLDASRQVPARRPESVIPAEDQARRVPESQPQRVARRGFGLGHVALVRKHRKVSAVA